MPVNLIVLITAQYGDEAMTAWTMFSWRRLYNRRGIENGEETRIEIPADSRQLVYNVYVYFSRRPGRSSKTSLTKTARATMLPKDIVADIIRDRYRN